MYPFIVNIVSVILGAFLLVYLLKPRIEISDYFTFYDNSDSLFFKFYNKSKLFNIIDVKTSIQFVYINQRFSQINTANLHENKTTIILIPRNKTRDFKYGNKIFYCSRESDWTRGVKLRLLIEKLQNIREMILKGSYLNLVLKVTYKSELTGIKYTKTKIFELDGFFNQGGLNDKTKINTILSKNFAKEGYFQLGPSFEIVSKELRGYQDGVLKCYFDDGFAEAKRYVRKHKAPK